MDRKGYYKVLQEVVEDKEFEDNILKMIACYVPVSGPIEITHNCPSFERCLGDLDNEIIEILIKEETELLSRQEIECELEKCIFGKHRKEDYEKLGKLFPNMINVERKKVNYFGNEGNMYFKWLVFLDCELDDPEKNTYIELQDWLEKHNMTDILIKSGCDDDVFYQTVGTSCIFCSRLEQKEIDEKMREGKLYNWRVMYTMSVLCQIAHEKKREELKNGCNVLGLCSSAKRSARNYKIPDEWKKMFMMALFTRAS